MQCHLNAEQDHLFYVLPYEKQLLQKKRGASSVAYLLLLKWFEKTASFPDSIDELPEDFIKHAIVYFADSIVQGLWLRKLCSDAKLASKLCFI